MSYFVLTILGNGFELLFPIYRSGNKNAEKFNDFTQEQTAENLGICKVVLSVFN